LRYFSFAGYVVNKTGSSLDCEHTRVSLGWVPLKFQCPIHIHNNFELTGDPFKLAKLYNT